MPYNLQRLRNILGLGITRLLQKYATECSALDFSLLHRQSIGAIFEKNSLMCASSYPKQKRNEICVTHQQL